MTVLWNGSISCAQIEIVEAAGAKLKTTAERENEFMRNASFSLPTARAQFQLL
jgi:hypothetical protein